MNEFIGKQNSSVIFSCMLLVFVYVATYVSQFEKKRSVFTQLKHCKYSINI